MVNPCLKFFLCPKYYLIILQNIEKYIRFNFSGTLIIFTKLLQHIWMHISTVVISIFFIEARLRILKVNVRLSNYI